MRHILIIGLVINLITLNGQVDSLLEELHKLPPDTNRISLLSRLSFELRRADPDLALKMAQEGLQIADSLQLPKFQAMHLLNISDVIIEWSQFEKADSILEKVLTIANEINDSRALGGYYYNKSLIAERQGNIDETIRLNLEAIRLYEQMDDDIMIGATYEGIGLGYAQLEDWDNAARYYRLAKSHFEKADIQQGISSSHLNLAEVYYETGEIDSAILYYQHGYRAADAVNSVRLMAWNLHGLASMHQEKGLFELARIQFNQTLELYRDIKDVDGIAGIAVTLGDLALESGSYSQAINYYQEGLLIANEYDLFDLKLHINEHLAEAYQKSGEYNDALIYYRQFQILKDTLTNRDRLKSIAEMETKYQTEQKEKQITIQQLQLEAVSNRNRSLFIGLILAALLLVTTVTAYFLRIRAKNAEKKILEEQYRNEKNRLELAAKKGAFDAFSKGQEEERRRIAEELHDDIGASLSGIQLKVESHEKEEYIGQQIKKVATRVREISHDLMPPNVQELDLKSIVEDYLEDVSISLNKIIKFHYHQDSEALPLSNEVKLNLFRILQESLQNIVKHADASNVEIQCNHFEDYINLIIEDDGKGMKVDSQNEGIGLRNIGSRVQLLNGTFEIDSAPRRGTILSIHLPLIDVGQQA